LDFEAREERKRPWQTFSGGLGCGCLTILLVGAVMLGPRVLSAYRSPEGRCQMNLTVIGQGIMKYRAEHSKYPPDLAALVPKYVKSENALYIPRGKGQGKERFQYRPPPPSTPPWEPVIEPVRYKTVVITLLKNGTVTGWPPAMERESTDGRPPEDESQGNP
jgi:hypothetical protein